MKSTVLLIIKNDGRDRPSVAIEDEIDVTLNPADGNWHVVSTDEDAFAGWHGVGEYQHEAILSYLQKRLGIGLDDEGKE